MNFKEYNSSQITPQLTLQRKFNKLTEWLLHNSFTKIYKHTITFRDSESSVDYKLVLFTFDDFKYNSSVKLNNALKENTISEQLIRENYFNTKNINLITSINGDIRVNYYTITYNEVLQQVEVSLLGLYANSFEDTVEVM